VKQKMIRMAMSVALLFGCAALVWAQGPGRPRGGAGGFGPPGGGFTFEGAIGHFGGRPVTNAPVTCQVVYEHTQKLQDGTAIDNKTAGTFARDSYGRTNRQITMGAIGPFSSSGKAPNLAFVSDPVGKTNYVLDNDRKTFDKLPMMRGRGGNFAGGSGTPPSPPQGGGANRPRPNEETLASKSIEGLLVQGTRITHTIPAGKLGNAAAIVSTVERWYSPDLHMVISETTTDPRFGTTTMNIININRAEPDASLFTVPADYTAKTHRNFRPRGKGPGKVPPPPPGQD
jgi:hypothetical protein